MAEKTQRKILIKWVRSGIGFSYRAKEMIRSLGLRRLHQVVERPDTPQIRGLVARVPHLVEVVTEGAKSFWPATPEYSISAPEPQPVSQEGPAPAAVEVPAGATAAAVARKVGQRAPEPAEKQPLEKAKRASASKVASSKKQTKPAAEKGKTAKKRQSPAQAKRGKAPGKGKK